MFRRILFAGVATMFFLGEPAYAAEFEITVLEECRDHGADPTLIKRAVIAPGKECGGLNGSMFAIEDNWLGIRRSLDSKGASLAREIVEPQPAAKVAGTEKFKVCLLTPPDNAYVDEWFVPADRSCKGRQADSALYRRYLAGEACLMPRKDCVKVRELKGLAQQRVHNSISAAIKEAGGEIPPPKKGNKRQRPGNSVIAEMPQHQWVREVYFHGK